MRAILADAGETAAGDAATAPRSDPAARPWLPADDFTVPVPAGTSSAATAPAEPPPDVVAHRSAGRLGRLIAFPVRIDPGWRGAVVIGIAVLVAAVVTGGWVLTTRPRPMDVSDTGTDPAARASASSIAASAGSLGPAATAPGPATSVPSPTAATLVVDVAGKVRHPGLYRLAAGSRVDDAVQAAGGALPGVDLTTVNLAAMLTDGQQVAVGMPGATPVPAASGSGRAAVTARVDLNTATLDQLETLPGVGPVLGQHILDWRAAHGRFATVEQLQEVSGIGPAKFGTIKDLVTL